MFKKVPLTYGEYFDQADKAIKMLQFLNIPFQNSIPSISSSMPDINVYDLLNIIDDPDKRDNLISKLKLMAFQ